MKNKMEGDRRRSKEAQWKRMEVHEKGAAINEISNKRSYSESNAAMLSFEDNDDLSTKQTEDKGMRSNEVSGNDIEEEDHDEKRKRHRTQERKIQNWMYKDHQVGQSQNSPTASILCMW
jgi:hypothetical protein